MTDPRRFEAADEERLPAAPHVAVATGGGMELSKRIVAAFLLALLALGGVACGDDPGEDEIGDGEVIDEGD